MKCRIIDMKNKEVISVKTGMRLGCVNDVEIDVKSAKLSAIVIYGRLKFFGIFGREDDLIIKWEDIDVIGEDIILVKYSLEPKRKRHRFNELKRLFWKC